MSDARTTGERVRDAVADDLLYRLVGAFETVEGGALDGIAMLSRGRFDEVWQGFWREFEMPLPSPNVAEVTTPARVVMALVCPECKESAPGSLRLHTVLTAEGNKRTLKVKATAAAVDHVHGQQMLPTDEVGTEPLFDIADIVGDEEETEVDEEEGDA